MSTQAIHSLAPPVRPEAPSENVSSDIDLLLPIPDEVTLVSGEKVDVKPLRTREFFALFRILTRGAAPQLSVMRLSLEDEGEFAAQLIALLILAFPEAENETIHFVSMMVEPQGLMPENSEGNRKFNSQLRQELADQFINPDPTDIVEIVSAVVRREASNLQDLGKKVRQMWNLAQKVGQLPKSKDKNS